MVIITNDLGQAELVLGYCRYYYYDYYYYDYYYYM